MKKKSIAFLLLLLSVTWSNSQILISEIMYNPPESGTDSLEYVELYNSLDVPVNLNGYQFVSGIEHTFGDMMIPEGGFVVLAKDPDALMSVFGIESTQWDSGSLKNDGELIRLTDGDGNFIDSLDFDVIAPWPNFIDGAAGAGASIEFCLDTDDNAVAENWKASTTETGDTINNGIVRGTPGAVNSAMCVAPPAETVIVTNNVFTPADITINIGDRVLWRNEEGFHNVNGTTVEYPNNPEGFGNGAAASAPWEYEHTFTMEGVYDYHCDPHLSVGMTGTVTVVNNIPQLVITEIMYNDPSPDELDSLEYIEVFNAGDQPVSLGGLVLTSTVINFTLPDSTLSAGEYLIIQKMPSSFIENSGALAISFINGGLGNNSDSVTLSMGDGTVIDRVVYEDSGDWPLEADGLGASLSLCEVDSDNSDPANWQASSSRTDREFAVGEFLFANPGAANTCSFSIEEASEVDEVGVATMLGKKVKVEGVVYGVNLRPGGLQFTIINDENNGIAVFSASENFDYEVQEGDLIEMEGTVAQFNGLTQLNPFSLELLSADSELVEADVVVSLGEETESSLVTLQDVYLVDPSRWNNSGSGFNVDVTNGTDTFAVRIDADVTDLYESAYPTDTFDITGIGGQFDNSEPFLDGYQLLPRYIMDIDPFTAFVEAYPLVDIGEVTQSDENGIALSLGRQVEIRGITHGINFRPSGLQFTIIDENNDGIGLFSSSNDFAYQYTEGDLVSIKGAISQFNGLTQISPDSIRVVSSGNALQEPTVVEGLGEDTESQYIQIESAIVVDASDWRGDGSSFNVDFETSSGNIVTVRIDADSELSNMTLPGSTVRIRGIGGQFDSSEPFTEGYQVFPSYNDDVVMVSSVQDPLLDSELVSLFPNPVKQRLVIETDLEIQRISVIDVLGRRVLEVNEEVRSIDLGTLTKGTYFLRLETRNGIVVKEILKL